MRCGAYFERVCRRVLSLQIFAAIRHDSPGFTRARYSLRKPVRLLRKGEQGHVKCPHERSEPAIVSNCVKLRIRRNAKEWAGVVGDSPRLIRELEDESSLSKICEAIRHDSPGFTLERYSLHKPVRLLRNGEQGYVKCPHERGWPLAFANCVKLRIRGNAWERAGVVGDSPWLIRELEDESFPSANSIQLNVMPTSTRVDVLLDVSAS